MTDSLMLEVVAYDDQTKRWKKESISLTVIINDPEPRARIIFTSVQPFIKDPALKQNLSSRFRLPSAFWSETFIALNGFFGSSSSGTPPQCDTWFRFKIKQLVGSINTSPSEYFWIDMCFFSSWDEKANTMICFDLPDNLSSNIMAILEDRSRLNGTDTAAFLAPYSLHTIVLDVVIPLFDKSIWTLSNNIRMIEQYRDSMRGTDFPLLHDLARHTAHATETLTVASNVIDRMSQHADRLTQIRGSILESLNNCVEGLRSQHSVLEALTARSLANEKRLSNEVNLAFYKETQRDNDINIEIARAAKTDSTAMKTISIVTLTFLPATFISALFGMNFLGYSPDDHGGHITTSPDLWIYFVISVPVTVAVLGIWWVWQRKEDRMERKSGKVMFEGFQTVRTIVPRPTYP